MLLIALTCDSIFSDLKMYPYISLRKEKAIKSPLCKIKNLYIRKENISIYNRIFDALTVPADAAKWVTTLFGETRAYIVTTLALFIDDIGNNNFASVNPPYGLVIFELFLISFKYFFKILFTFHIR